jgi:hypothetical protein
VDEREARDRRPAQPRRGTRRVGSLEKVGRHGLPHRRGITEPNLAVGVAGKGSPFFAGQARLASVNFRNRVLGPTPVDDIEANREELVAEIAAVANAVLSGTTLEETLQQVVVTAVSAMDGCDSAGVFVVDGRSVRSVAFTSDAVVELDRLQDTLGGPCLDAAPSGAVVYVSDLSEDDRYPGFRAAAATADIRTVLACPALWTLRGPDGLEHSVTADESAPRCDRHPGELEWEAPRSFHRTASGPSITERQPAGRARLA